MKLRTGIWIGVGAVVVALVATPFLLPLDTYRGPIERAASSALGREVHIRGPLHLTIYPQLGLSLSDVTIANMPGARETEMASIGSVLVGAELMPLLSRRLEVTEVVLQKPVIHLEVNPAGAPNWRLAPPPAAPANGGTAPRRPANAPAAAPAQADAASGFDFRTVSIDGGEITYFDARSKSTEAFTDISIKLNLQSGGGPQPLNAPLKIDGQLTYNAEPLKIDAKIDRFGAMLNGQPTGMHVGVTSNIINADFTGSLGTEGRISGALKMGAHSVRSFAAWTGHPMPPGNGFGLMAMEGQFSVHDGVYTLRQTHLAFDSMSLNADISLDTNPDVLAIKGMVTIDRLDVNPYLAPGKETDTVKANKAKAAADSGVPLELGWLKAANADLKLVLGGLVLPNFKIDQAIVDVALKNGVLKADLSNVTAYGGNGKGNLTLDASGATPALHETLDVSGLKAQPFLNDLIGVDRIAGTGAVRLDLSSRGSSEEAIVKDLNGKGSLKFNDGTISGVDLAAVSRLLQSVLTAEVLTGAVGDNAKTAFGQMGGTFTVQNGVLRTNDLALVSPAVDMTAKGTVDLSAHALEFHFEPKAKKGIPGLKLVDIGVPFYVKGPWDKPSYGPDAGGLAKGIVSKLGEGAALPADIIKDPGGALRSLFGGGKDK
jgi:AsmA protein